MDELLVAISHHQRREALNVLHEANSPLAVADLAGDLVRQLEECPDDLEANRQTERLKIELYHCHLPKLAAAGLVTFDPKRNVVSLTDTRLDSEMFEVGAESPAYVQ